MNKIKNHKSIVIAVFVWWSSISYAQITVSTAWADYICEDPVVEGLIVSPVVQRMKDIAVAGPTYYLGMVPDYTRYSHSMGVWWLLKYKAQTDKKEQLAGLLHDASHTVFSHLGDMVFGKGDGEKSYQDTIHLWFLSHYQELMDVLDAQGLTLDEMDPDHPNYRALEQPLPELCADRIEYNLHTGVIFGRITKEEARSLIDALEYQHGFWFFTDVQKAKQFALLPLYFTRNVWAGHENVFVYYCFSRLIGHALKIGLLSHDMMHFGGDMDVMQKIRTTDDPFIRGWLARAIDYKNQYTVVEYGRGTINSRPKCRAVDPYVYIDENFKRLSEVDVDFARQLYETEQWCRVGYGICFDL